MRYGGFFCCGYLSNIKAKIKDFFHSTPFPETIKELPASFLANYSMIHAIHVTFSEDRIWRPTALR